MPIVTCRRGSHRFRANARLLRFRNPAMLHLDSHAFPSSDTTLHVPASGRDIQVRAAHQANQSATYRQTPKPRRNHRTSRQWNSPQLTQNAAVLSATARQPLPPMRTYCPPADLPPRRLPPLAGGVTSYRQDERLDNSRTT